jgi:hypothetical protein
MKGRKAFGDILSSATLLIRSFKNVPIFCNELEAHNATTGNHISLFPILGFIICKFYIYVNPYKSDTSWWPHSLRLRVRNASVTRVFRHVSRCYVTIGNNDARIVTPPYIRLPQQSKRVSIMTLIHNNETRYIILIQGYTNFPKISQTSQNTMRHT